MSAFPKAPGLVWGWGRGVSDAQVSRAQGTGQEGKDIGRVAADIYYTVSSIESLLVCVNCRDNSERKMTLS